MATRCSAALSHTGGARGTVTRSVSNSSMNCSFITRT